MGPGTGERDLNFLHVVYVMIYDLLLSWLAGFGMHWIHTMGKDTDRGVPCRFGDTRPMSFIEFISFAFRR